MIVKSIFCAAFGLLAVLVMAFGAHAAEATQFQFPTSAVSAVLPPPPNLEDAVDACSRISSANDGSLPSTVYFECVAILRLRDRLNDDIGIVDHFIATHKSMILPQR